MSNFRRGSSENTKAYIRASIEAGVTEGEDDEGTRAKAKGEAFPTQGLVIFPFRFPDELRFGSCNAMGKLRSETSVRQLNYDHISLYEC